MARIEKKLDIFDINRSGIIEFEVPLIPPSTNIVYKKSRAGMVYKTGAAKEFELQFMRFLKRKFKGDYLFQQRAYELNLIIYFEQIKHKNQNFVKLDASNHIKIVEDCIEKFFNYNDKCNIKVSVEKRECSGNPRIYARLRAFTEEEEDNIYCGCSFGIECRINSMLNSQKGTPNVKRKIS